MSSYPDFSELGYQVERELGQNRASGRVTYLATNLKTQQLVVIKQFQFARSQATWSDYDAYQREIQILQQLNHPSIPRYLASFEIPSSGFCLVQEYKPAYSLTGRRYSHPEEIKLIAVAVLEVLVYLQQQVPSIIHRDIKPENILVQRQQEKLQVYLVDFGFASFGDREVAVSSVVKGTLGFMPPEQIFNRQLTEASDLYSLGATLICLLTETKSTDIGNLFNENYRLNFSFKHLPARYSLVPLNPQFIEWLEKMVAPSIKNRYANAAAALKALEPIEVYGKASTPLKMGSSAVKLFTVGFVALLGTSMISNYQGDPVRRLLQTRSCQNCDLTGADLEDANLVGVELKGAELMGANLKGAELMGANLKGANLISANLKGANLENINLEYAYLHNAELNGANLKNAQLKGIYLFKAKLKDANLESASLSGANLKSAQLNGANLKSANLEYANLKGTNLKGAKMPDGTIHP